MTLSLKAFHVVLLVGIDIAARAIDKDISCAADGEHCVKPNVATHDDDATLAETSLLQTHLAMGKNNMSAAGEHASASEHQFQEKAAGQEKAGGSQTPTGCTDCINALKTWIQNMGGVYTKSYICELAANNPGLQVMPGNCGACRAQWQTMCTGGTATTNEWHPEHQDNQVTHSEYVPGQPGAPWTEGEILAVKGKLQRLFAVGEGEIVYDAMNTGGHHFDPDRDLLRLAPKTVRLSFHDCHLYKPANPNDPNEPRTGGCDGALVWQGMGDRFLVNNSRRGQMLVEHQVSHNNGLMPTVEMLEKIYTEAAWPPKSSRLPISLRQSGKSRADLWALAGIAGVEYGFITNNKVCDDPEWEQEHCSNGDCSNSGIGFSGSPHCHHKAHDIPCHINLNNNQKLRFTTGRKDKQMDYKVTTEGVKEVHADATADGHTVANFFVNEFRFTGRDAVAILGTHSMGRVHFENTMLRYNWVVHGDGLMNNQYYRNIVKKATHRFVQHTCGRVGLHNGSVAPVRWLARVQDDNTDGGPYQFVQEILSCPDACAFENPQGLDAGCCDGMTADGVGKCTDSEECVQWRWGTPGMSDTTIQTALGAEMALYYKWRNQDNFPAPENDQTCQGLKDFNKAKFAEIHTCVATSGAANCQELLNFQWSGTNGTRGEIDCPFQDFKSPDSDLPLHEIFELYANNQDTWLTDFAAAWDKMVSNGYVNADGTKRLVPAPDQWTNVECPAQDARPVATRYWFCYKTGAGLDPVKYIKVDGQNLVIQEDDGGALSLQAPDGSAKQKWQKTKNNFHWVNLESGQALVVEELGAFEFKGTATTPGRLETLGGQKALQAGSAGGTVALTSTVADGTMFKLETP